MQSGDTDVREHGRPKRKRNDWRKTRKLARTCSICANPITDKNKSGCCTACWQSEDDDVRGQVYDAYERYLKGNMLP